MDPHSPNKLIATKYCSLILGDDTSFFFLSLIILVLFLCYVIFIHFVIINFYKIELFLLLFLLLLIYLWNIFFMFLNVPNFVDAWPNRLGPFFTSYHQDRCQEIKFFVGSIFSGSYLPRNLPVKGLNKEYYIWSAVLVLQNSSVETHLLREYCTFAQPLFCF